MKEVTKEMIKIYNIKKLKYDFMGYTFQRTEELSFHHLIIPKRECKEKGIEANGYLFWNGAILNQDSSHDYLHLIERIDREIFLLITNLMIEENKNMKIDIETLKKIRSLLTYFEKEHENDRGNKDKILIKRRYITNRIELP